MKNLTDFCKTVETGVNPRLGCLSVTVITLRGTVKRGVGGGGVGRGEKQKRSPTEESKHFNCKVKRQLKLLRHFL